MNPVSRGRGQYTASYMPLSVFIRGLHALTLRCHTLSNPLLAPSLSVYPSVSLALSLSLTRSVSLCSHARQLTFRCRNRTFLHDVDHLSYVTVPWRSVAAGEVK